MRFPLRTRHRRPTRTRMLVLATVALGVLGAGAAGIASAQTRGDHRQQQARPAAAHLGDSQYRHRPRPTRPTKAPTATPTTVAPTTAPPTTAPTTVPPTAVPPTTTAPTGEPTVAPTTAAPTTPPTTPPSEESVITQALAHINAARTANNLTPYVLDANLTKAAEAHTALMVGGCGLSHQCPGELGLGERFTAAGVKWNSAGENIGQGNAQNNDASILTAANGLTDLMLAEVPPNDGHRKNLLNAGFKRIGLAVARGSDGKVWFTQDFAN
ncbi:CAP domain-containing protein [Actinoplanes bogorensis]|uniref:CAP domain-containing protein n=1 Tax=Paractinoplanes bogorensis TaxID=1610840 RepID=A0ABS5YN62_9ACTN|nr:CAP domain-containing protein [Actinoplanes bogorensis]MBU2664902.1 CAP domain-containing protein [Actinoplanes bogorensis]